MSGMRVLDFLEKLCDMRGPTGLKPLIVKIQIDDEEETCELIGMHNRSDCVELVLSGFEKPTLEERIEEIEEGDQLAVCHAKPTTSMLELLAELAPDENGPDLWERILLEAACDASKHGG